MKKNILIGLLSITSIVALVLCFYYKREAERMRSIAIENEQKAMKAAELARDQAEKAHQHQKLMTEHMEGILAELERVKESGQKGPR